MGWFQRDGHDHHTFYRPQNLLKVMVVHGQYPPETQHLIIDGLTKATVVLKTE